MSEIVRHVLAVLPEFTVACLVLAALPGPATALFLHRTVVLGTTATLAAVQVVIDSTYCAIVVLLASRARRWLSRVTVRRRLERVLGATLVALGIDLAAATR
jgi:threonine/homoserine/homoserine lactone efflux protein